MKKMKVLYGPTQSGKTKAAKQMVEGKNAVWIEFRNKKQLDNPYFFHKVNSATEVIVFDDVPVRFLEDLMSHLFLQVLTINSKGQEAFQIERPDVIITTDATVSELPNGESTKRRFEFIKFSYPNHIAPVFEGTIVERSPLNSYYYSFKVNKKKIKGKVEAETHRDAWTKVVHAVDTLEKLGGISVTDVTIPSQPQQKFDPRLLIP